MRIIAAISSFLLDSAVGLMGIAFIGASTIMFNNDIRAIKKNEKKENKNEDQD